MPERLRSIVTSVAMIVAAATAVLFEHAGSYKNYLGTLGVVSAFAAMTACIASPRTVAEKSNVGEARDEDDRNGLGQIVQKDIQAETQLNESGKPETALSFFSFFQIEVRERRDTFAEDVVRIINGLSGVERDYCFVIEPKSKKLTIQSIPLLENNDQNRSSSALPPEAVVDRGLF